MKEKSEKSSGQKTSIVFIDLKNVYQRLRKVLGRRKTMEKFQKINNSQ